MRHGLTNVGKRLNSWAHYIDFVALFLREMYRAFTYTGPCHAVKTLNTSHVVSDVITRVSPIV